MAGAPPLRSPLLPRMVLDDIRLRASASNCPVARRGGIATAQPLLHLGQRGLSQQARGRAAQTVDQRRDGDVRRVGDEAVDVIVLVVDCGPETNGSGGTGIGIAWVSRWSRGTDDITESKSSPRGRLVSAP